MHDDDRWEEDRWEPSERLQRAQARGPGDGGGRGGGPGGGRSMGSAIAVVVAAVVVGALGGYAVASSFGETGRGGSDDAKTVTEVVTATITEDAPVEDPNAGVPPGEAVSCARGPGEKKRFEPNETPRDATGPLVSGEARTGRIGNERDIDHWAICVDRPVEVTFSIECTNGECDGLFGTFPAGESFTSDFDPDTQLSCRIPRRGRYVVAIDSRTRPVNYSLTVSAANPTAIVTKVDSQFPDGELGDDSC